MGWIDRIFNRLGLVSDSKVKALANSMNSLLDSTSPLVIKLNQGANNPLFSLTGLDAKSRAERLALYSSWVYSDVEILAKIAAKSEFQVWDKIKDQIISEHELPKLLQRPTKKISNRFMIQFTISWLLLRGEAYWLIFKDNTDTIAEVWPVPSDLMQPFIDNEGNFTCYEYRTRLGQSVKVPLDRVVYFHTVNEFDINRGKSRLSSIMNSMEGDIHATRWNLETFTNEAQLTTIFSINPDTSPSNYKQIKAELEDELINQRNRYIVVKSGDIKVDSIGLAHRDLEYMQGRIMNRDEIDRVFGIPTGFWSEKANYANMEASQDTVIEHTVWPLLQLMAEAIQVQLLDVYYPDKKLTLEVRPKNIKNQKQEENDKQKEVMTIDEVRATYGMKEWGNDYGKVPYSARTNQEAIKLSVPALAQSQEQAPAKSIQFSDKTLQAGSLFKIKNFDNILKSLQEIYETKQLTDCAEIADKILQKKYTTPYELMLECYKRFE